MERMIKFNNAQVLVEFGYDPGQIGSFHQPGYDPSIEITAVMFEHTGVDIISALSEDDIMELEESVWSALKKEKDDDYY
jgi:hypothetical protein